MYLYVLDSIYSKKKLRCFCFGFYFILYWMAIAIIIPVRCAFWGFSQKSPPIIDNLSYIFSIYILLLLFHNDSESIFAYTIANHFVILIHVLKHSSGYDITFDLIDNRQPYIINSEFQMESNWANDTPILWSHSQCFVFFFFVYSFG